MNIFIKFSNNLKNISDAVRELRKNWVYSVVEKISFICILLATMIIIWRWNMLPPQIPLWYSRLWGIDRLTSPKSLILLVSSLILFHFLNIIVSITFLRTYRIFIQALFVTSMFVSLLALISITEILFLIT
jgi:hypothetical protein